MMNYTWKIKSPVGVLTLAGDGESITGLWIEGQKYYASKLGESEEQDLPVFQQTKEWLDSYFKGHNPDFMPPLAPEGSEFRHSVWNILRGIPYGQVITYGDIAKRLEQENGGVKPVSAQAVGGAVGHNPISIMIPCHRVVGAGGNLTGYAGGIPLKIRLLELEHTCMDGFYIPKNRADK